MLKLNVILLQRTVQVKMMPYFPVSLHFKRETISIDDEIIAIIQDYFPYLF